MRAWRHVRSSLKKHWGKGEGPVSEMYSARKSTPRPSVRDHGADALTGRPANASATWSCRMGQRTPAGRLRTGGASRSSWRA